MIVISDTTPILSLLKAEQLDLLEKLFGNVIIPKTVYEELTRNPIFESEKVVIANSPFITVEKVCNQESVKLLRNIAGLDAGESEALVLYEEKNADILLIDEHKGRGVARKMSVKYVGNTWMEQYKKNRSSEDGICTVVARMKETPDNVQTLEINF